MKKILIALTNADHFEKNGEKTGLWLAEAIDFALPMEQAGYHVDYVSPNGGQVPLDPRSLEPQFVSAEVQAKWDEPDFKERALQNSLAAKDINPADYAAIYFAGGHGVLFDFPDDENLIKIAETIYANQGFVASVCHGVAGLLNLKDETGAYLIAGKKIAGFTNMEEVLSGKNKLVPFSTEDEAKARGAKFKKGIPFKPYAVSDQRMITGQNPMSGKAVAEKLLAEI